MPTYQNIGNQNPDGVKIVASSTGKAAFFGATPRSQVTASSYATSDVGTASSTDVDSKLKASVIAIMNTLSAYGLWPAQG